MHIGGVLHHQQQITCHRKTVGRIPPDSLGQVCHQLLHLGVVLRQGIIEHIAEMLFRSYTHRASIRIKLLGKPTPYSSWMRSEMRSIPCSMPLMRSSAILFWNRI